MFAITGITGQVGSSVARSLLAAGRSVRAVVRDPRRAQSWAELGCQVVQADIHDAAALESAFAEAEGVFILAPPNFDPEPGFPEARSLATTLRSALLAARPGKVVYLSTIGAQSAESNLLTQHTILEQELCDIPVPITFLRPAWFLENASWDVAPARQTGVIPSFLQPLDRPVPMVGTADIGRVAAELLQESWSGIRVVELEGPSRTSPNQIAAAFAELLGRPVRAEAVPRATWESLFRSQGMQNPTPRIRMLDGFNEGWIDFESKPHRTRKGEVPLNEVLKTLIDRGSPS